MTPQGITVMFLSLGVLLGLAHILGEISRKLSLPAIVGELLAGVLLGPTVLGNVAPDMMGFIFPAAGANEIAMQAITTLSVTLFLLVAGMEVDLSVVRGQGRVAPKVSFSGICIPFVLGFLVAMTFPRAMGLHQGADGFIFALFFATAMSISALPVIAKTLMDLGLYRSELGLVIVSAAVIDDLIGWIIFAVILGMIGVGGHSNHIGTTIGLTLVFAGFMLTVGRWLIDKILPFLQTHTRWPSGVLGFALTLAMLGAAFTEWIGIHAIFGAFLVGVAIGDSSHLRESTRSTIEHFVSFIFAPLFFASIGLRVDFTAHFDLILILTVLTIACVCKLLGGYAGARWGGMSGREAWAVGFAMNSRGAMEIILGILALKAGIINDRLFVALIVMAIVTSMIAGPCMKAILRLKIKRRITDYLSNKHFISKLHAASRRQAIHELVAVMAETSGLESGAIEAAVWKRETTLGTGIGNGVALPHARIKDLSEPLVAVGISDSGIDFDAPDGKPANVIFLILSPRDVPDVQLEIVSEIARLFKTPGFIDHVLLANGYNDFLVMIKDASLDFSSPK